MLLDLRPVFEIPGHSIPIEMNLDAKDADDALYGETMSLLGPITVRGEVRNNAGIVTLDYSAGMKVSYLCDLCLDSCETTLKMRFSHQLARTLNQGDEMQYRLVPDGTLDMADVVREDVILEWPMTMLCREDCKGLCPECGANRNHGECSCETETGDPRLQALRDLLQ